MIEAKHNKIFRIIFDLYLKILLRKNFSNFYLVSEIPSIKDDKSILVLPNHFSWWDGFFVDLIHKKFYQEYKIYMMVLEETIEKFWFFNHIGAFTINPSNPKDTIKSFQYAGELLKGRKNFIVIFPQGELTPYSVNVRLKPGVFDLICSQRTEYHALFLAMKIVYFNQKNPDVYFHFKLVQNAQNTLSDFLNLSNLFNENLVELENSIHSEPKIKIRI